MRTRVILKSLAILSYTWETLKLCIVVILNTDKTTYFISNFLKAKLNILINKRLFLKMDPTLENKKEKIRALTSLVGKLKREMEDLYEDYDVKVGPNTTREEESAIEAVCWAKEVEYTNAKQQLSLLTIRLNNYIIQQKAVVKTE